MSVLELEKLIENVLNLYRCKATDELLESVYSENPSFEDPISFAQGRKEVWSQWYSMPRIFSNSVTNDYTILVNEKNHIEFSLSQTYTFKVGNRNKKMQSKVVLDLDENGKVTKHQDLWNGKELNSFLRFFRILNAKFVRFYIYGFH